MAISTRALPPKMEVVERDVKGKSCRGWKPGFQLAVDDALASVPEANALVNAEYRFEGLCLVVLGTAVRVGD